MAADLEWKVIYVGSAEDTRYDQVLEEVDVGPIPIGVNKFVLTAGGKDNCVDRCCWGIGTGLGGALLYGGKGTRGSERAPFPKHPRSHDFVCQDPAEIRLQTMPRVVEYA